MMPVDNINNNIHQKQNSNDYSLQKEEDEIKENKSPIDYLCADVLSVAFSFLRERDIFSCLQVRKNYGNWRTALGNAIKINPHLLNKFFSHCLNFSVTKNGVDKQMMTERLNELNISLENCIQRITQIVFSSLPVVDFISKNDSFLTNVDYLLFDRSLSEQKKEITKKFSVLKGEIQKIQLIFDYFKPFGAVSYKKYWGVEVVGDIPPCPDWPDKSGFSVLIPSRVSLRKGKVGPFTLNLLEKLIQRPKEGLASRYGHYDSKVKKAYGKIYSDHSYWVSLSRDIIDGSRFKRPSYHLKMIEELNNETNIDYLVPSARDVVPVLYAVNAVTGERPYGDNPWTYTRCIEFIKEFPVLVGGFSQAGVKITYNCSISDNNGIAVIQKV